MSAAPWYRERAAYLMGRSRAGTSARRRAEILAREARRAQRSGVGVGEAVAQDELTPPLWRRATGKEGRGWFVKGALTLVAALVAVVAGPGIAIGRYGIYEVLVRWVAPRIGRLHWWPWATVAAALLAVRWFVADWPLLGIGAANRYYPWEWVTLGGLGGWLQFQAVAALAATAFSVWAWGWAGVPKGAVAPPERNRDGSFYVPDENKRVALSESAPVSNAAPGYEVPEIREIPRVQLSESNEDMLTAFGEAGDDDDHAR